MLLDELRAFIGVAPPGYEWLEYAVVAVFAVILVQSCVTFVSGLFRLIGGK